MLLYFQLVYLYFNSLETLLKIVEIVQPINMVTPLIKFVNFVALIVPLVAFHHLIVPLVLELCSYKSMYANFSVTKVILLLLVEFVNNARLFAK
jgi:hypothetical protein